MFVMLKSKNDRERTAQELVIDTRKALQTIPGQKVQVFNLSNMGVSGDGDFAFEAAEMAKLQLKQQAGVAALAQANRLDREAASSILSVLP